MSRDPLAVLLGAAAAALILGAAAPAAAAAPYPPQPAHLLPGDGGAFPAPGDQTTARITAGGPGFLAVWVDDRATGPAGGGTGRDIYAARLDADGNLLDTTPILVAGADGDQTDPVAVWNGQAWLVIWTGSLPHTPYPLRNTEAVRVSGDGQVLDAAPFEIWPSGNSDEHVVGAASDGQDWAVVMTDVYPSGLGTNTRLVSVPVAADGTVGSSHIVYSPSCCSFFYRTGMAWADGVYLVVFEGYVDSWNYGIFGLRLGPNLTALDSYPPVLVQTDMQSETHFYSNPTVTSDGTTFYVAWQFWDRYVSSQVYGARVTSAGQSLDGNGVAVSGTLPEDMELQPAAAWDGVRWTAGWPEGGQRQLARIDAAGTVLDPGGVATGLPADADFAGTGDGLQLAWSEAAGIGAAPFDALTARAAADLSLGAPACVALAAPSQLAPDAAAGGNGALVTWVSRTSGGARILARPVDEFGQATGGGPLELATGTVDHPRTAWDGQRWLVVWDDGSDVFGARIDGAGSLLDPTPKLVLAGTAPDVAGRADGFFVAVADAGGVRAVRVGGDGTVLDGTPLAVDPGPAAAVAVGAAGALWFAAWERTDSPDGGDIVTSAVDGSGLVLGPIAVTPVGDGAASRRPAVAAGDSVLIAWEDDGGGDLDLLGRRLGANLGFADPAGVALLAAAGDQAHGAAAWDGQRFLLAGTDTRDRATSLDSTLTATRGWAAGAGPVAQPEGAALAAGGPTVDAPAVAGAGGNDLYVVPVFHPEAPYAAYRLEVAFAGLPSAVGDAPAALRLPPPYPNPANPAVNLRFTLARGGDAVITIYDARGRRVRTLRAAGLAAGDHVLRWDGTDDRGRTVSSGSYLVRLRTAAGEAAGKVAIVR